MALFMVSPVDVKMLTDSMQLSSTVHKQWTCQSHFATKREAKAVWREELQGTLPLNTPGDAKGVSSYQAGATAREQVPEAA